MVEKAADRTKQKEDRTLTSYLHFLFRSAVNILLLLNSIDTIIDKLEDLKQSINNIALMDYLLIVVRHYGINNR